MVIDLLIYVVSLTPRQMYNCACAVKEILIDDSKNRLVQLQRHHVSTKASQMTASLIFVQDLTQINNKDNFKAVH